MRPEENDKLYGKLFEQMFDGTLATKGPWQALVTFQQFIILADKRGDVDMTPEAISRRTTIPLDIIQTGIKALEEPDPDSRSPDLEGRRLVRLSDGRAWGWTIVNYAHYRNIRSQEERREYMRGYQKQRREDVNNVNNRKHVNQPLAMSTKAVSSKHEAVSKEALGGAPKNGARHAPIDSSPIVQTLPLRDGTEYAVRQSLIAELEPLYPSVDVAATVNEMKGWLIGNRDRRKTRRGIRSFMVRWLHTEQQKSAEA